eukprot:2435616-Rhodomonas_salina.1
MSCLSVCGRGGGVPQGRGRAAAVRGVSKVSSDAGGGQVSVRGKLTQELEKVKEDLGKKVAELAAKVDKTERERERKA